MKSTIFSVLSDFKKLGFKLGLILFIIVSSFILLNIFASIYPLIFSKLSYKSKIFSCLGSFIIGFIFVVLALVIYYRYAFNYGLKIAYPYLEPFLKKISISIISRVYNVPTKKLLTNSRIKKTIDWKNSLRDTYQGNLPWIIKKIISFLMNKIPFTSLINQTNKKCKEENISKEKVGELFYFELDEYIKNTFLSGFSLKWIVGLFFINILIQIIFLVLIAKNF